MEVSQIKRYLNKLVYYLMPYSDSETEMKMTACRIQLDTHDGMYRYFAELQDIHNTRSILVVPLEDVIVH